MAALQVGDQPLGHAHRRDGIDAQRLKPAGDLRAAEAVAHSADAGVVDEDIDGFAGQRSLQGIDLSLIGHVQPVKAHIALDHLQLRRLVGIAAGSMNAPAFRRVLANEFQADPPIRAGDQDCRHRSHHLEVALDRFL